MSSNKQPISIDRTNYQEFFLLYVDGELTSKQNDAVETYAAGNPDLGEELNTLLSTKLQNETFVFDDKESLLSQNIMAGSDELLLLYIDNELPASELKNMEHRIKEDVQYEEQYRQLQAAKLDSKEIISYPNKKELYRSTEVKVRPLFWMRIAVAIVVLFGSGIFWLTMNNTPEKTDAVVVVAPSKKIEIKKPDNLNTGIVINSEKEQANDSLLAKGSGSTSKEKIKTSLIAVRKPVGKGATQTSNKSADEDALLVNSTQQGKLKTTNATQTIIPDLVVNKPVQDVEKTNNIAAQTSQQTINTPAVTTTNLPPYNTIETAATDAGLSDAVASNNSNKKGSVRGFLRKATRFIERRTGINPVNEDDELLIGVVAVKL